MPVCAWHGTEDKVVGYDGTDFISKRDVSLGAEDCARWCAEKNGCEKEPKVERWSFAGTTPVVFYKVTGGGHTWPGSQLGKELLGKSTEDVNASEVMWEFFSKYSLPEPEKPK